jgi:predicted small integral membrane protein
MAWTWQTALFFAALASLLALMTVVGILRPEVERVGVLGIATTRGDRLFISLLGSAFIQLAWLGIVGPNLWWAVGLAAIYAFAVFRWV